MNRLPPRVTIILVLIIAALSIAGLVVHRNTPTAPTTLAFHAAGGDVTCVYHTTLDGTPGVSCESRRLHAGVAIDAGPDTTPYTVAYLDPTIPAGTLKPNPDAAHDWTSPDGRITCSINHDQADHVDCYAGGRYAIQTSPVAVFAYNVTTGIEQPTTA